MTKDQAMLVKTSLALALVSRRAKAVIDNWDKGDLAAAVRGLAEAEQVGAEVFAEVTDYLHRRLKR